MGGVRVIVPPVSSPFKLKRERGLLWNILRSFIPSHLGLLPSSPTKWTSEAQRVAHPCPRWHSLKAGILCEAFPHLRSRMSLKKKKKTKTTPPSLLSTELPTATSRGQQTPEPFLPAVWADSRSAPSSSRDPRHSTEAEDAAWTPRLECPLPKCTGPEGRSSS